MGTCEFACQFGRHQPAIVRILPGPSLKGFDLAVERAAWVNGASPLRAIVRIAVPTIATGILVGAIFVSSRPRRSCCVHLPDRHGAFVAAVLLHRRVWRLVG